MPTPFPGMDPYLEDPSVWEEFHHIFITECMYYLSERLPESYIAKIDERVELVSRDDEAARQYLPDVAVVQSGTEGPAHPGVSPMASAAVLTAPVVIPSADAIEVTEAAVHIIRLSDMKLITAVELLSPWNKFGEGIGEYRHKRRGLVRSGVHVVEIDLLRRGRRTELARPLPAGDFYAFIFRAERKPDVDVYAWKLRQPLPNLPVPLAPPDPDCLLNLSSVVNTAYDRGRMSRKLRYSTAPPPGPITPEDADWATRTAASV